jgi:hypothetical protein
MHVRASIVRDEELAIDVIDGKRTQACDPYLRVGFGLDI